MGIVTANEAGTTKWDTNTFTITLDKIPAGQTWWIRSIQSTEQQALESFNLNEIDKTGKCSLRNRRYNINYEIKKNVWGKRY